MESSTIAAIATATGRGGIGIIRISGSKALSIATSIFRRHAKPIPETGFASHKMYFGHIVNEEGRPIDEVLMVSMHCPFSYTREDVVELHTHSGPVVLKSVLEQVLKSGARLAEPGEFTKRAFLNGRIDLSQAEAVMDIIHARTEKALAMATAQIKGGIRLEVEAIRSDLIEILAEVEADIDFPEDVEGTMPEDWGPQVSRLCEKVVRPLEKLLEKYDTDRFYRDGLKVVIAGRPNVGKSSLLNRMVGRDRMIVTPIPGTTRDIVEESLIVDGIPILIMDTAGLHESEDPVESIGIGKTRESIGNADLVLFVIDTAAPLSEADHRIVELFEKTPFVIVHNKSDLVMDDSPTRIPKEWNPVFEVRISALLNRGIDELTKKIGDLMGGKDVRETNHVAPNLRHKKILEKCLASAATAKDNMEAANPFEIIAMDLEAAAKRLDEITGEDAGKEVLDQIFNRFCIGK